MDRWLNRYSENLYAVLRIVAGLLFMQHGAQKLFGVLGGFGGGGQTVPFLSQFWFAGVIETFGGLLIVIGLFASWAAFIASGEMAVAYFQVHAPMSFWPILNQGEIVILFCFIFLYIASRGSGLLSVDRALGRAR